MPAVRPTPAAWEGPLDELIVFKFNRLKLVPSFFFYPYLDDIIALARLFLSISYVYQSILRLAVSLQTQKLWGMVYGG